MHVQASKPLLQEGAFDKGALEEGALDACAGESKKKDGGACPLKSSLAGVSARARQVAKAMERNCCSVKYAKEQAPRVNVSHRHPPLASWPMALPLPHPTCWHSAVRTLRQACRLRVSGSQRVGSVRMRDLNACTTLVHLHSFYHRVYAF